MRPWEDSASTRPSCSPPDTSAPSELQKRPHAWNISKQAAGAVLSVSGSSVSSVAGISVRQAFLAPAIGILPRKRGH